MTAKKLQLEEFEEKIFLLLFNSGSGKTIEQLREETGTGYNRVMPKIKKLLKEKKIKKMRGFPTRFALEKESEQLAKKIIAKKDYSDLEQLACEIR